MRKPLLEGLKVALVHDWLTGMRGGEKCLEVLCELFNYFDRMKIGGKFEDKDLDDDNGNKVYDGALKFSDLQSPESPESAGPSVLCVFLKNWCGLS